ncbi:putative mucin TcSMUGL [Trypanosoma cruzi]|uniref:Putative mucin TcSMUGL n=1 Tax=Trypanosoma cruzi TaxID=5693 RepID=A0A2V2V8S5_TRYCR|nr:putative mucin TcSMUGL [Trypanosoma cruzi]
MISGSGQQPRRIYFFSSGWVCLLWALTVCVVCVLVPLRRGVAAPSRLVPLPRCLCSFVCMPCTCPCLFLPCCVLSLCPPGAGPTGEFTPRATSEVHKGQVTMMLRRVLCVLFFALCCACVCATAQEEGQYDAAVFKAAGGDPKKNTTTTTTTTTTTSKAPKNTTTTTSKAPTPEDARSPGGPVWVQVPLLLLVSAAVATAGAAC